MPQLLARHRRGNLSPYARPFSPASISVIYDASEPRSLPRRVIIRGRGRSGLKRALAPSQPPEEMKNKAPSRCMKRPRRKKHRKAPENALPGQARYLGSPAPYRPGGVVNILGCGGSPVRFSLEGQTGVWRRDTSGRSPRETGGQMLATSLRRRAFSCSVAAPEAALAASWGSSSAGGRRLRRSPVRMSGMAFVRAARNCSRSGRK